MRYRQGQGGGLINIEQVNCREEYGRDINTAAATQSS